VLGEQPQRDLHVDLGPDRLAAEDELVERRRHVADVDLHGHHEETFDDALDDVLDVDSQAREIRRDPGDDPLLEAGLPIDPIASQLVGLPSPPLSTKPSVSSFYRGNLNWSGQLTPSSEIPGIVIADPDDEWANKLGHANFTIYPEPYTPESFDLEACRQLRANWDLARCNYTKHLVRTGEHYGVTSKTYKLTEEKWASIDTIWRKNNEITISRTVDSGSAAFATLKHTTFGNSNSSNIMTKIPSLNDPRSEGKFPQLGDEDIVGPMVQVTAQLQRTPSKKAKFFKFIAEKFPVGLRP